MRALTVVMITSAILILVGLMRGITIALSHATDVLF